MITRKIHLIEDFKINILLENNVLESELFDIFMSLEIAYIESCDVTISIKIFSQRTFQSKLIHFTKFKTISLYFERLISIHKAIHLAEITSLN